MPRQETKGPALPFVKIDTHTHSRFSGTSTLPIEFLIEQGRLPENRVIVCTDDGTDEGIVRLFEELADALVIPGIEVETEEGDMLVFSTDRDYIHSLCEFNDSVRKIRRDDETAVIWAHPCITQRKEIRGLPFRENGPYDSAQEEMVARVVRHVDGLEVCNGTMLSLASVGLLGQAYFDNLVFLSERFGLARTGGSDAHEIETWGKVWTEFPEPVDCVGDFIQGLKRKVTRPGFDREFFPTKVGPDLCVPKGIFDWD